MKNHLKRRRIMLESWDEISHMLHACTKRFAPLLHQTMYDSMKHAINATCAIYTINNFD